MSHDTLNLTPLEIYVDDDLNRSYKNYVYDNRFKETFDEVVTALDELIQKCPNTTKFWGRKKWKGIRNGDLFKVLFSTGTMIFPEFLSVTLNLAVAEEFADNHLFELDIDSNLKFIDNTMSVENEIIYQRDLKFTLNGCIDGTYHVRVTENK